MTTPDDDRERLRQTFNQAAGSYQQARPDNAVRRHWGAVLHIARRRGSEPERQGHITR